MKNYGESKHQTKLITQGSENPKVTPTNPEKKRTFRIKKGEGGAIQKAEKEEPYFCVEAETNKSREERESKEDEIFFANREG